MKTNSWLVLGMLVATSAVAQQASTNAPLPTILPPVTATPATTPAPVVEPKADKPVKAPAKKPVVKHKKASAKAPAKAMKPLAPVAPLVAGPAKVAADKVNLRGQAGLKGEVVGHLNKGDAVTVITDINLDKVAAGEPAHWAKIALPSEVKVWVNSQFVDATTKAVTARKLNLRGGPGENYSVLGMLEKGAVVKVVETKGEWTQIEAPTNAFAFIAASYLSQENPTQPPVVPAVEPQPPVVAVVPPTPSTVPEPTPIVTQPAPPVVVAPPVLPPVVPPVVTPPPMPEPPVMVLDTNPPPPRIVTHEGYVRSSVSIVAPTYYELYDAGNGKAINYLYSTTTNLDLGRYEGLHINVTGEEGLDRRWKDTPVITVQKIYVLGTNAPAKKAKFHLW